LHLRHQCSLCCPPHLLLLPLPSLSQSLSLARHPCCRGFCSCSLALTLFIAAIIALATVVNALFDAITIPHAALAITLFIAIAVALAALTIAFFVASTLVTVTKPLATLTLVLFVAVAINLAVVAI
jgi:hypothetical protein